HESKNRMIDLPDDMIAQRAYDNLYFYFPGYEVSAPEQCLIEEIPSTIRHSDGTVISCNYITAQELEGKNNDAHTYVFSESAVRFPLVIRSRREGERMTYDGLKGTKKLKRIFIDEKIPRHMRTSWPILVEADG